jgi:hypothetical protein
VSGFTVFLRGCSGGSVGENSEGGVVVIVLALCDSASTPALPAVLPISVAAALSRRAEADALSTGVFEAESEAHRLVNGCGIEAAGGALMDCVVGLV